MAVAKRVFLFLMVNFLVMASLMAVFVLIQMFLPPEMLSGHYNVLILFSLVFGFGGAFISLLVSKFVAKRWMGVQIITEQTHQSDLQWVKETTFRLAKKAGIDKMPEVGYYDSPEINAFATGPTKNNSLVAVSTGLIRSMNRDEIEGVLGHEVAHIANGDMVTMTLVQGIVNAVVIFFTYVIMQIIENALRDDRGRGGMGFFMYYFVYNIIHSLLAFMAMPLVAFVSRIREYRADAGGASLAGREKMIQALKALQAGIHQVDTSHQSISTLKISNKSSFLRFWSTHPPLKDRIHRLERGGYRTI